MHVALKNTAPLPCLHLKTAGINHAKKKMALNLDKYEINAC